MTPALTLPEGPHSMEPVFAVPDAHISKQLFPYTTEVKKDDDDQGSGLGPLVSKQKWPIGLA